MPFEYSDNSRAGGRLRSSVALRFWSQSASDGGRLNLLSLSVGFDTQAGEYIFELEFEFPHPSKGTTTVQFTVCCSDYQGVSLQAQGSDLSIDEGFPGSGVPDLILNHAGTVSLGCAFSDHCGQNITSKTSLFVTTTITDNAGDIALFSEGFATPEPNSSWHLGAGLLCIGLVLRRPVRPNPRGVPG